MIIIPMAGLSVRFSRAGYTVPKYQLPLNGYRVFDYSVASFRTVFDTEEFLFVAMRGPEVEQFISDRLVVLGVRSYRVVLLDEPTRGQAETVVAGLDRIGVAENTPVTIFNIDTFCLKPFEPMTLLFPKAAGVLQVFKGTGDNWSFVQPDPERPGIALRTAEKIPISDLCCTGLYHFARLDFLRASFLAELILPQSSELYIAPLYNHLISRSEIVVYVEITRDEVVFCGVPAEYEMLLQPGGLLEGRQP
jgi:MobA-like NTP transferase domain